MPDAEVDTRSRFYVLAAASSINVAQNEVLGFRRGELLGIFDDSFPTESECLGTPHTINSSIYDFFTGIKKRVANTILGSVREYLYSLFPLFLQYFILAFFLEFGFLGSFC